MPSPSRISPPSASCWSRAATFAVSPATKLAVGDEAGPATGPVLALARVERGEAEASFELAIEPSELRPHLDRRPHGAQGIVLVQVGIPKTASTASPTNFASVPPWRSTIGRIASKYSVMTCESASGSSCSPSEGGADDVGEER